MLRKVFCILLAVCLSVPLACPALAADTPDVVEMPAVVTPLQKEPAAEEPAPEEPAEEAGASEEDAPSGLTALFDDFRAEYNLTEQNFAVSYYDTVTQESYDWNETHMMVAASTFKLPLNLYYYEMENAGEIASDALMTQGGATLDLCHYLSIVESNNEISHALLYRIGTFPEYKEAMRKYFTIETTLMRGTTTRGGYSETAMLENQAGAAARSLGYSEIITYSFVSPASFDAVRIPKDSPLRKTLKLVNPLGEDTSIMRTIILPSMLDILSRNYAMKNKGVKLYELGRVYLPVDGQDLPEEPRHLIFGTYGEHETFFTMKGEIDALLQLLNVKPAEYVANRENPSYHPGRCADILIDGKLAGTIGQIHPLVAEAYGIGGEVYVADLDFTTIEASLAEERVFHSLPRFPAVTRDLALVCDESLTVGELERCISAAAGKLLRKISLFDIYRGPGVAAGKKSVAFSLELRADDRTLTDEDSTGVVDRVLKALKEEKDVTLR